MFDFLKKERTSTVAVFDVASDSVGGLLFEKQKEQLPNILISIRKPIKFPEKEDASKLQNDIIKSIQEVASHLKKHSSKELDSALFVFSSPWYVSKTQIVKIKKQKRIKINQDLIDNLIDEEAKNFREEWGNSTLEHKMIRSVMNGYATQNPLEKKAKDFELYIYLSLVPEFLQENIKIIASEKLNTPQTYMHSFPFVLWKILLKILNLQEDSLFIDINGEITDVFVIRDGILEEISTLPKGENFFINRLASGLNLEAREAKNLFLQHKRGDLKTDKMEKVQKILEIAATEWGKHLKKLLKEIAEDKYLPQNLYFLGPAASLKEVQKQIVQEDLSQLTIWRQPFVTHFLLPESLKYHFKFKKGFDEHKDIFLLLATLFANQPLNDLK